MDKIFEDRADAGRQLARMLGHLHGRDVVVLGLPSGGVPVAYQVAQGLQAPLDVIIVRRLAVPEHPELKMGTVGERGVLVLNPGTVHLAKVTNERFTAAEEAEEAALDLRAQRLRGNRPAAHLTGRTVVIVDDGIATGATARAACKVARARGAAQVILAVPVAPADLVPLLRDDADEVVCVRAPGRLGAIGQWYADFAPISDDDVRNLLSQAAEPADGAHFGSDPGRIEEVEIRLPGLTLPGSLNIPAAATGLVIFVHGSGSSRLSGRNRYVAAELTKAGLGTLLFDLLSPREAADRANVFDIRLLAHRLTGVTAWLRRQPGGQSLPIGWFGASTGAGAALWAAARPHADVAAIVSRGGRPDLAGPRLPAVTAPTLLIVGSLDTEVLALNRAARNQLRCPSELAVVPGATHLFEEPGTLALAAEYARSWFTGHLRRSPYAG